MGALNARSHLAGRRPRLSAWQPTRTRSDRTLPLVAGRAVLQGALAERQGQPAQRQRAGPGEQELAVSEIRERNRERDLAEVWGVLTQAPADVRRLQLWVRALRLRLRARRYARLREKFEVERWLEAICVVAPPRAATRGGIHME